MKFILFTEDSHAVPGQIQIAFYFEFAYEEL